jgi:hypothetical protein
MTVSELIERLKQLDQNEIIAVPVIRTKSEAEDIYEYANFESIILTDDEWRDVVNSYEDAEFYDDEALVNTIDDVIGGRA